MTITRRVGSSVERGGGKIQIKIVYIYSIIHLFYILKYSFNEVNPFFCLQTVYSNKGQLIKKNINFYTYDTFIFIN